MRISVSALVATILAAPLATPLAAAPFDGPFVGAQLGWQSGKLRDLDSSLGTVPVRDTKQSVTGGVFAGYDRTINGRFVVGAEGGIDLASDDDVTTSLAGTSYSIDPKYSLDLTARAGVLVNPQTLLYVRGGYSNARVRTTVTSAAGIAAASDSHDGWLAGAGAERQLNDRVSARLEYRYSRYSEDGGRDQRNRVLAGLSYGF